MSASTSGVAMPSFDADALVLEAWERCGKTGEVMSGEVARAARRSLNMLLVAWQARGWNTWQVVEGAWSSPGLGAPVVLPADTVEVSEVTCFQSGRERLLTRLSRDDYVAQPSKLRLGLPSSYWFDRASPHVFRLYPVGSGAVLDGKVWYMRRPDAVEGLVQGVDVAFRWQEATAAELAARLAVKMAPDRVAMLRAEADQAFADAASSDHERVPLIVVPVRRR